jgi:hypothetical protein
MPVAPGVSRKVLVYLTYSISLTYQLASPAGVLTMARSPTSFFSSARHRRVDGDVVFAAKNFIVTDDAKALDIAFIVFNLYPGAEEDFALLLRGVIDDL